LLDFAGALSISLHLQGRSFKNIIENQNVSGWDEVYASHSLHEIMMYYPMRAVRERKFKLIYNIAYPLSFPQSLDLHQSFTWQAALKSKATYFGKRPMNAYLHRPKFELYNIENDPNELHNLANDPKYGKELERMKEKLKRFQKNTSDMWFSKWEYE